MKKINLVALCVACLTVLRSLPVIAHNLGNAAPPGQTTLASQGIRFESLSVADGLSQSIVTAVLQDQQGFMWFGTQGGLNKYDGYQFSVYKHDPDDPATLSDNQVHAIYQDRRGELWIGTNRGLDRFEWATETFTHYEHNPDDAQSLSVGAVLSIYEDSSGALWVGTGWGLDRFDRAAQTFSHYLDGNLVRVIYEDTRGELWVGTSGGLVQFDRATQKSRHYRHAADDPTSLSHNHVQAIFEDRQGTLWVGTDGGGLDQLVTSQGRANFFHYGYNQVNAQGTDHSLSDDRVTAILEDSAGRLWVGTRSGLDLLVLSHGDALQNQAKGFDPDQRRFIHYRHDPSDPRSLSDDLVWALYEDSSGVLWVGTHSGLSKQDRTSNRFEHHQQGPNALSDNVVQAIYEDESSALWVGTFGGGLNKLDRHAGRISVYEHEPDDPTSIGSNDVRAIYKDRDGVLWVGTDMGLDQFEPQTETFVHYPSLGGTRVTAIAASRSGDLWIGTSAGLYRLDRAASTLEPLHLYGMSGNYVLALHEDASGALWIGTHGGGINLWDDAHNRFTHYAHDADDPSSLSNNVVLSFYELKGTLWVGTEGGGLDRFDWATQAFTHYTEQDGLPGDTIGCILADADGCLWLGANKGLSRFDPQTESLHNYSAQDGLQRGEFLDGACFQSERGEMFFGGMQGFNAFYAKQIKPNPHVPPIAVTALDKFDKVLRADLSHIQMSHRDNFVSFEFAALDYVAPEKNQYAYRMEGLDQDWVYAGTRRRVTYPDLRPGDYVFRVKASNNDGVWNEEGVALRVTVTPPVWETWWFRGVMALILAGGAVGAYRLRLRSIRAQSRELEEQVEERTAELSRTNVLLRQEMDERQRVEEALAQRAAEAAVAAERNRLARDMHDSVTQSLYSLTLLAEAGQRLLKARNLGQAEGNQARLSEISQQALQEMRLMVYELRPLALKSEGLVGALQARLEAIERRAGVDAHLVVKGARDLPPRVEEELYRITQEALNNALKHAQALAVRVTLRAEDGNASLEVLDDGRGFDLQAAGDKGGLGLVSMQERAEALGGTLTITSAPGEGTKVKILGIRY